MKFLFTSFSFLILLTIFTGCAGNKNLQEKAPAQFQQPYYETDAGTVQLYIPVSAIQDERVSLNRVIFQGKQANLNRHPERAGLYVAEFYSGKPDLIMSSDPAEEYRNKMPDTAEKVPFKLKDDEAVVVFIENGEEKFYKLTGIEQRSRQ